MALTVFLPVFLTAIAGLTIAMLSIDDKTATDTQCKREALRLQSDLGRLLEKLIKMNRSAKSLRAQRAQADAQLAAATASGYPPAIAAAQSYQSSVISAQLDFAAEQQSVLSEAALRRQRSERELPFRLPGVTPDRDRAPSLAVRPDPPDSLTPDYLPDSPFEHKQRETFRYGVDILKYVPAWFKSKAVGRTLAAACSATLQQEGSKWKPALNGVKP